MHATMLCPARAMLLLDPVLPTSPQVTDHHQWQHSIHFRCAWGTGRDFTHALRFLPCVACPSAL